MRKNYLSLIICAVLLSAACLTIVSHTHAALAVNIQMTPTKTVYDIGDTVTIRYTITPSRPCMLEATVQVSPGLTFGSATVSLGLVNGTKIVNDTDGGPYAGQISATANTSGNLTISLVNVRLGYSENPDDRLVSSKSVTVYVRTAAEKQEAEERAREEQERIRREQEAAASAAASRQAEINASIAESVAKEQSIRESIEIEESIRESILASIYASESEEELTRPSEIGDRYYAELVLHEGIKNLEKRFYFALEDENILLPEGYEPSTLVIRSRNVFAAKTAEMDPCTYLVYGVFEGDEDPHYYYYHTLTGSFFPYAYLHQEPTESETEEESESEEESEEDTESESEDDSSEEKTTSAPAKTEPGDPIDQRKLFEVLIFSFLLGVAVAVLIALIVKKKDGSGKPVTEEKAEKAERAKRPSTEEPEKKTAGETRRPARKERTEDAETRNEDEADED